MSVSSRSWMTAGGSVSRMLQKWRNWRFNMTYYTNATNLDVPALVTVPGSAPVQTRVVGSRDYDRLQLDMNFKY